MAQGREGPTPAKMPKHDINQGDRNEDVRLVKWFCEDLGPYCILDYNGCRNYFKDTVPNYTLPSMRDFLEKLVPEQYRRVSSQLKITLQSVDHVAISMDTWKYAIDRKRRNMWTGTVHYVHQGKLISQILFTKEMPSQPKPKEEMIKKILSSWSLLDKVVCFVTGHERNDHLLQIVNLLQIPNIFCAAAAFRLTFQECLNYLTTNEEFRKKFQSYLDLSKLKKKKEEPFCWHNQFIALQDMSEASLGAEKTELTECVQILKPFVDSANELSRQQYSTLSSINPLIVCLKLRINGCSVSTDRAKGFKIILLETIDSHFGPYENELLALKATFMDPRFRKNVIKEDKASFVQDEVIGELYGQNPGNPLNSSNAFDQPEPTPSTSNNLPEENVPANDSKFESSFAILDASDETETKFERSMIEVKTVNIPKIKTTENPFEFWEQHKSSNEYKKLYKMSQKYLCIPATAIHAESISGEFLWGKAVLNNQDYHERRNQLEFKHVNEILFLHSYYCRD